MSKRLITIILVGLVLVVAGVVFISNRVETKKYGYIEGQLSYPSDYIPRQVVCAKNIKNEKKYCTDENVEEVDGKSFRLKLPVGEYYVYAYKPNTTPRWGGFYSNEDNDLISAIVEEGKITSNVNPWDWYRSSDWYESWNW